MDPARQLGMARDRVRERVRRRQEARWKASGAVHESVRLPVGSRLHRGVTIGAGTTFSAPPTFSGTGPASVGRYTAVGEQLYVITSNHDPGQLNMHFGVAQAVGLPEPKVPPPETSIGDACWIGTRVTVLSGATIGHGCVIGAGSVVTGHIPPFSVAAGVPCRPLRTRFPDPIVEVLLEIRWWDWSLEEMARARPLFELELATATPDDVRAAAALRHG